MTYLLASPMHFYPASMKHQIKTVATVIALAVISAERALAQEQEATRRVVINIPAMTLQLFEDEQLVKTWPVAVGKRSTQTPVGTYRIANQVKSPTWWGPNGQVVKAGAGNPVGTRWIGLDKKGYGIHGTNAPKSIGRAASHGCVRMRNSDVEELFTLVRAGDEVVITYETVLADGTVLNDVYGLAATVAAAPAATAVTTGGGL